MTIRCSHLAAMALALAASPAAGAPSPLGNQPLQRRTATLKALPADFGAFLAADLRKEHSRLVTAAMRRNASMNAGRYDWAKRRVSELQTRLAPWLKATDKALWDLLPSQEMPRDFFVHRTGAGCPACAAPVVYNAWKVDIWKSPWTVSCPSCRTVFPSNDFASYYRSSLDATGRFRPGAGDPRFLEPRAGAEARWADDGTGVHQGDQRWFFAARCAFVIWQEALRATAELAELYTLTDDPAAAHAAGVLLARTADLYPEMDYTPHARDWDMEASTGGSGLGRIQGCIWECFTVTDLATAYDHVFDALLEDTALAAFVAAQPSTPDRGAVSTPRDVAAMIQRRLIMEGIRGVLDGRVRGNPGMHQTAMAAAAMALDHPEWTPRWLDWLFTPEGGVPHVMNELLSRDGASHEASLGYCMIPGDQFSRLAEMLRRYTPYDRHDLYRDYPKFRAYFTLPSRVRACDAYAPHWADDGQAMRTSPFGLRLRPEAALGAYLAYRDPVIAREVLYANLLKADAIRLDPYADAPEALRDEILAAAARAPAPPESLLLGGHGGAILHTGTGERGRAATLYYGRMAGHGHADRLSLTLYDRRSVVAPDLGNPAVKDFNPLRIGWVSQTASHNTVVVDGRSMDADTASAAIGRLRLLASERPVRVVDADGVGPGLYPGVRTFRRLLCMVDVDDDSSYVVDVFWVRGGAAHCLVQNGGAPEAAVEGAVMAEQPEGTYAGAEIPYGTFYDGRYAHGYRGAGFQFLTRVSRSGPVAAGTVTWPIADPFLADRPAGATHLRLHNLTAVDELALADGPVPAFAKAPKSLRYSLRARRGEDLSSQFVSVLEPFGDRPFIQSVRLLESRMTADDASAAVQIVLADGREDVVLIREHPGRLAAAGVAMDGRVAVLRRDARGPLWARLFDGLALRADAAGIDLPATVTGRVAAVDDTDPTDLRLAVDSDTDLTRGDLVGRVIHVETAGVADGSYRIERVIDARTLGLGPFSAIEGYVDPQDDAAGWRYVLRPGAAFRVPHSGAWGRPDNAASGNP